MYNWRLLLLAFFAVFQPIASFTERNPVDGRQQCCDHRLERDSAYSLYGNPRLKQSSEDRRLTSSRRDIREVIPDHRQHENTASYRLAINPLRDSDEGDNRRFRSSRIAPEWNSRSHADRERITRGVIRNTRSDRIRFATNRRNLYRDSRLHQVNRDSTSRITRDVFGNVDKSEETRVIRSQRDTRRIDEINRDNRETRAELHRARYSLVRHERPTIQNDRRIANDVSHERRVPNEFRSAELRFRERLEFESRSTTMARPQGSSKLRRSVNREIRRENEFEVSSNIVNRAYNVDEIRNNARSRIAYTDERRFNEERNAHERRSIAVLRSIENIRDKAEDRSLSVDRRSVSQLRNIRYENPVDMRHNVRTANQANRRNRDITTEKLSRPESRLSELNRENRGLDSRGIVTQERRVAASDKESRNSEQARNTVQMRRIESRDTENQRQIKERATPESMRLSSRMFQRDSRIHQNERRETRDTDQTRDVTQIRRIVNMNSERTMQFRERSLTETDRLSSRMTEREISRDRYDVRDNERRETRDVDRTRDNVQMRRTETRITMHEMKTKERISSESDRQSPRVNVRENSRDRHIARDNQRRDTRDADRTRDNVQMRRTENRNVVSNRQMRSRSTDSDRLSSRVYDRESQDRHSARVNERRETRDADRTRDAAQTRRTESRITINERQMRERISSDSDKQYTRMSDRVLSRDQYNVRDIERREIREANARDNIQTRRIESPTTMSRLIRARPTSASDRLSLTIDREIIRERDNERREIRISDRTRNIVRMGHTESRSSINERQMRERATYESNRLSVRMNERENVRDRANVRRETRDVDKVRDNIEMRSVEIRNLVDERDVRQRATSESRQSKLSDRETARARYNVRENERRETHEADRTRDNILMRHVESRNSVNEREVRERTTSANRLSRVNEREISRDRHNARDNERRETRLAGRNRDNIRASESDRLTSRIRDQEMRLNRYEVRDAERRETREADRNRESRNAQISRIEHRSRSSEDSLRRHAATLSQKNDESEQLLSCQYLIYTLQAIYLCSVVMPMIFAKNHNNKSKNIGWWSPFQAGIKID